MEMRPIDPLERVAVLERWELNQKRNRRRAAGTAWTSVAAAVVVLAGLIYSGHRELTAVRSQADATRAEVLAEQANLEALKAQKRELEQQYQASLSVLGNVGTTQAKAAVDQTLSQNPQAANLLPRVYLQIVDQNDRDYANYMGKKLKEAGFIVLGVEYRAEAYRPDVRRLKMTDVRYYKKADEAGAQKVLDVLKKAGEDPVRLNYLGLENDPKVRANHYEVWFAANSGARMKSLANSASPSSASPSSASH
jgi:hypothetical protein